MLVSAEPQGQAAWYPLNETPADKASYTFRITVAKPWVVAANGLQQSVTSGIVSQKSRLWPDASGYSIPDVLQFDAAINRGNSGGPLLNGQARIIGMNTSTVRQAPDGMVVVQENPPAFLTKSPVTVAQYVQYMKDSRQPVPEAMRAVALGGPGGDKPVANLTRKDGEEFWVQASTRMFRDEAGRPLRLVGSLQNVTERRRTKP